MSHAWAIEIQKPDGEWCRMNTLYRCRVDARAWMRFVKAYWYARHGRTVKVAVKQ